MNRIVILIVVIVYAFIGCKTDNAKIYEENNSTPVNYAKEIANLTTDESKKIYLENIRIDDQKVRGSKGQELMLQYGVDSKEHMDYVHEQWRQDSINLLKIEKYFELYGYPNKSLGEKATTAPWMVIHHSQWYESRDNNFEIIYKAYLEGNIDDGDITFYLGRMYQMKYGKMLEIESPFRSEEEIEKLLSGLELKSRGAKVLENYRNKEANKLK